MMYPSSQRDYIEGDNTLGDVSVSHPNNVETKIKLLE